jgi:tripartite-type tricarboxylate transporter receptor subunit TctC
MGTKASVLMKPIRPLATWVIVLVIGAAAVAPVFAQSSAWPTRPLRMVLGLPPGSGSDLLARALSQRLTPLWGQPVVVDNRPGGSMIVATDAVAKAAPDGHTLLFALDSSFTVLPHLHAKLPYDPFKDFAPVVLLTSFGLAMVAHPNVPAQSVPELIAAAKRDPGKLTYASVGAGSQMHLIGEMLGHRAGVRFTHVPYKGIPQMMTAVMTGEVDMTWVGVFTSRGLVAQKRLKALAYSGAKRTALMPDLPTFDELGLPDVGLSAWYGLIAPAGTPRGIVDRIHADVTRLMADPEFLEKEMLSKAYEPAKLSPDEFAAMIREEYASRAPIVKLSGAKVE